MPAYLNLVLKNKILATVKIDGDVREETQRLINNLHQLVELEQGRHEIVELPSQSDRHKRPDWLTVLRIVTTQQPPRSPKIKEKHRIAPDHWIGIRDYHRIVNELAQPLADAIANALMQGREISTDPVVNEEIHRSFQGMREHCDLSADEVAKAFILPPPYAWRCEGNRVQLVRQDDDPLSAASGSPSHPYTLH